MRDRKSFGGWLVGPFLLLLSTACGFSTQNPDTGSGSVSGSGMGGSGTTSGATSPSGSGASAGSTGTGSGESGKATSGSGSSGASSEPLDGGAGNDADFICPAVPTADMPVPGTCSAPADLRCPYPKLSQTGCVNPKNPLQLADVVIPYEVNSPLWSDGALKTRGMRIPTGGKIHVKNCTANPAECCVQDPNNFTPGTCLPDQDDGKWIFPVGTVMVKNFMFPDSSQPSGNKLVETRLFIHVSETTATDGGVDSSWIGYGYQWNEAQTEATVTSNYAYDDVSTANFTLASADAGTQMVTWHYPSRGQCMQCHQPITPTGGYTLGPETIQMNRIATGDTMNQIDKLAALGLFDTAPPKPYDAALVAPYPGQAGSPPAGATLDQRARSYLHANCSFCHRPDGQAWDAMDLRFTTPLQNTGICDVMPGHPDMGAGTLLLHPGEPTDSVLLSRMEAPPGNADAGDFGRMPAIGSFVIDTQATALISNWIQLSVTTCPPQ